METRRTPVPEDEILSGCGGHARWPELPTSDEIPTPIPALRSGEYALTSRVRTRAKECAQEDLVRQVDQHLAALEDVAQSASGYPSPLLTQTLGERQRNIQSLIERLTRQNTFSIELVLPTRAVVSHALTMARLNFPPRGRP